MIFAVLALNALPTVCAMQPEQDFKIVIKNTLGFIMAFRDYFNSVRSGNIVDAQKDLDMVRQTLVNGNDPRAEGAITRHDKFSSDGNLLLHHAPNAEMVQFLIDKGANVHAKSSDGDDALMANLRVMPDIEVIKTLLKNGASLHTTNNSGETPLDVIDRKLKAALEEEQDSQLETLQTLREFIKRSL